jgi:hypothetical protein
MNIGCGTANCMYKEPVFIVGVPRSGTTLLQSLLCNTDYYFPIPETHFFSRAALGMPGKNLSHENKKEILRILYKKSRIRIDSQCLSNLKTKKEIFEHIVNIYNRDNRNTFMEKTPRHALFHLEIKQSYPDARFICMVRDPKNTISSILKIGKEKEKSAIIFSMLYNKIVKNILAISEEKNVCVVRYEDLTDKPEKTLKNIFQFLKLQYNSKYLADINAPPEIISLHEHWKKNNLLIKTIQANDTERWRSVLSEEIGHLVCFLTKAYAVRLGYDVYYNLVKVSQGILQDALIALSAINFKKIVKNKYNILVRRRL